MTGALRQWLDCAAHIEPAWPVAGPDELLRPPVTADDPAEVTQIVYAQAVRSSACASWPLSLPRPSSAAREVVGRMK